MHSEILSWYHRLSDKGLLWVNWSRTKARGDNDNLKATRQCDERVGKKAVGGILEACSSE